MGLAIIVFIILFGAVAVLGLTLSARNPMSKRVEDVVAGSPQELELDLSKSQHHTSSFATMLERVGTTVQQGKKENTTLKHSLIHAGYREANAVNIMYGIKVVFPVFLLLVIAFAWHPANFLFYIAAGGLGYLLPDYGLQWLIKRRQKKIRKGLPDALDLLVICVEAGLGLDQALARCTKELGVAHPELADELNLVVLEQSAGGARGDSWRHLAERTGVDSVRHLVATVIQAEQFGTSIAKSLRVHSETLRLKRKQTLEEEAAKTSVKLVFPLVLFIFPSIMLVTIGPAMITILKTLPQLVHH